MARKTLQEKFLSQIPYRIHNNDKVLMIKLMEDDKINFQRFIDACVQAYLRGDPAAQKIVKDWKALNEIPPEDRERYTLSHRERQKIMDEIGDLPSGDVNE